MTKTNTEPMQTENTKREFKKGDKVYMVQGPYFGDEDLNEGRGLVCARFVTLTSLGKKQGTAEYNDESGNHIKERIYTGHSHFEPTREAVIEFVRSEALETFKATATEIIARNERDYSDKAWAQAQNRALREKSPSIRVWFFDGERKENVIVS